MTRRPDLRRLSEAQKDALIRDLWAMVHERDAVIADLSKRVAELGALVRGHTTMAKASRLPVLANLRHA